jgi:hypothetical protein
MNRYRTHLAENVNYVRSRIITTEQKTQQAQRFDQLPRSNRRDGTACSNIPSLEFVNCSHAKAMSYIVRRDTDGSPNRKACVGVLLSGIVGWEFGRQSCAEF